MHRRDRRWCVGMLATCAVLASGCGARTSQESGDAPLVRPTSERDPPASDAAVAELDATLPPSLMDAAPPLLGQDGSFVPEPPSDGSAPMQDAQADAQDARPDAAPAFYGEVVLEVLTKPSLTSPYQPRHVLAIWVEDDMGNPIKVLALWAGARRTVLAEFGARVGFGTNGFFSTETPLFDVDTITGATQRTHQQHIVTWDMTDHLGQPVAQGQYSILIELADDFDTTYLTTIALFNGPESVHFELSETDHFGPIDLTYTPRSERP